MLADAERRAFDARFARLWGINPQNVIPPASRHAVSIEGVGKGGVLRFNGELYVVEGMATYVETDSQYKAKTNGDVVTELVLFSLKNGVTRYLEWVKDDGVEISFTERKLTRAEIGNRLQYDDGESVDLDDMDEVIEKEEDIVFMGTTYPYDDDWASRYESSDGRKGCVYFYEFGDPNVGWLTVEAWSENGREEGGWEYEAFLSHDVPPTLIEVISNG